MSGFTRSLAMEVQYESSEGERRGEWREWLKPILFTGGLGFLPHAQISKREPQAGMRVAKIGGPVYRIGVGGGSASSAHVQGTPRVTNAFHMHFTTVKYTLTLTRSSTKQHLHRALIVSAGAAEKSAELDFNAVQRGDAEMEQKLNRLIRACVELGPARNPILSIHDQGTVS